MKFHRLIGKFNLNQQFLEITDKEQFNKIKNVLRLKAGSKINLADENSNETLAEIIEIKNDSIYLKIIEKWVNQNESKKTLILYCAILKKENFEFVVQKAVELGINKIIPIITERTIKFNIKTERMEKIIKSAAEQSGRGVIPIIERPFKFRDVLEKAEKENNLNLFFDKSGQTFNSLTDKSLIPSTEKTQIGIFIGPEGGWSKTELELIRLDYSQKNFHIINLGDLTLRAETAAIIACYLVMNIAFQE